MWRRGEGVTRGFLQLQILIKVSLSPSQPAQTWPYIFPFTSFLLKPKPSASPNFQFSANWSTLLLLTEAGNLESS